VVRVIVVISGAIVNYQMVRAERVTEEHMMSGRVKNGLILNHTSHGQVLHLPSGHPSLLNGHQVHQVVIGREK
jgi:hypothetical protein